MDKIIIPQTQSNPPETGVMNKALRALIADDSENDVLLLLRVLRKAGYQPVYERVCTAPAMKAALERQAWDIVISDYEMPSFGGFEALQLLKESGHDLPFILVSAVVSSRPSRDGAARRMGQRRFRLWGRRVWRDVPSGR